MHYRDTRSNSSFCVLTMVANPSLSEHDGLHAPESLNVVPQFESLSWREPNFKRRMTNKEVRLIVALQCSVRSKDADMQGSLGLNDS